MSELGESVKFKLRRARIEQLEHQQEIEDLQHLAMTAEQRTLLHSTFESVRTEFQDLDGLSWECEGARRILDDWVRSYNFCFAEHISIIYVEV